MQIRIGGYFAASLLLEQEPGRWHALILLDSGIGPTGFVEAQARSHLYLWFDDIEEPRDPKRPPTPELIEQALEFAKGKDRLLVTCRAGQGRSVALAYTICCRENGVADALRLLDATRHRPNRLVVALGDSILGGPDILGPFDEWRASHCHIRLSDYFDRLEAELDALEAQGARDRITGA